MLIKMKFTIALMVFTCFFQSIFITSAGNKKLNTHWKRIIIIINSFTGKKQAYQLTTVLYIKLCIQLNWHDVSLITFDHQVTVQHILSFVIPGKCIKTVDLKPCRQRPVQTMSPYSKIWQLIWPIFNSILCKLQNFVSPEATAIIKFTRLLKPMR